MYVRPGSHSSVRENDPDAAELLATGRWQIERHLRAWLAATGRDITHYLGSVVVRGGEIDPSGAARLRRRVDAVAPALRDQVERVLRAAISIPR